VLSCFPYIELRIRFLFTVNLHHSLDLRKRFIHMGSKYENH